MEKEPPWTPGRGRPAGGRPIQGLRLEKNLQESIAELPEAVDNPPEKAFPSLSPELPHPLSWHFRLSFPASLRASSAAGGPEGRRSSGGSLRAAPSLESGSFSPREKPPQPSLLRFPPCPTEGSISEAEPGGGWARRAATGPGGGGYGPQEPATTVPQPPPPAHATRPQAAKAGRGGFWGNTWTPKHPQIPLLARPMGARRAHWGPDDLLHG